MLWLLGAALLVPGRVDWGNKSVSFVPIVVVVVEYLLERYAPAGWFKKAETPQVQGEQAANG